MKKGQFTVELAPFTLIGVPQVGSVTPHHVRSFLRKTKKAVISPKNVLVNLNLKNNVNQVVRLIVSSFLLKPTNQTDEGLTLSTWFVEQ